MPPLGDAVQAAPKRAHVHKRERRSLAEALEERLALDVDVADDEGVGEDPEGRRRSAARRARPQRRASVG
jgi:hypothetical protein